MAEKIDGRFVKDPAKTRLPRVIKLRKSKLEKAERELHEQFAPKLKKPIAAKTPQGYYEKGKEKKKLREAKERYSISAKVKRIKAAITAYLEERSVENLIKREEAQLRNEKYKTKKLQLQKQ